MRAMIDESQKQHIEEIWRTGASNIGQSDSGPLDDINTAATMNGEALVVRHQVWMYSGKFRHVHPMSWIVPRCNVHRACKIWHSTQAVLLLGNVL
jgi:hypothetical protein